MNISFAKLGEKECEECKKYKQHECSLSSCESETGQKTSELNMQSM